MTSHSAQALTLLAISLLASAAIAETDSDDDLKIYLEQDGIVLFEVEDTEPSEGWELKTELDGFRGTGYFEWAGPNRFHINQAGSGTVTYYFRIETAGNYQMRWRNRIAIGDQGSEHNDSWIRFSTGSNVENQHPLDGWTKVYSNNLGSWSWNSSTVDHGGEMIRQYFSQGDHTLELSGRSPGHAIDQISLYRYQDVPYSPQAANNWDLSPYVAFDGTIIIPPEPEEEEEPEPEPEPVALVNLDLAPESWLDLRSQTCVANTLAISASDVASFDPSNAASGYTQSEFVAVNNGLSAMLLSFDTSLVPPATSAVLEYSTGEEVSDGDVTYALGSHNDWQTDETTLPPEFVLELGSASGGWIPSSRYQSTLQSDSLAQGLNTIIVSSATDTDSLEIYAETSSDLAPRLLLTGDESFCANWQANVDAANEPIEPPEEINEPETEEPVEVEQEGEPEEEMTPNIQPEDASQRSSTSDGLLGGAASWLMLSYVGLLLINRRRLVTQSTASIM